jgi:hypothetical protein
MLVPLRLSINDLMALYALRKFYVPGAGLVLRRVLIMLLISTLIRM